MSAPAGVLLFSLHGSVGALALLMVGLSQMPSCDAGEQGDSDVRISVPPVLRESEDPRIRITLRKGSPTVSLRIRVSLCDAQGVSQKSSLLTLGPQILSSSKAGGFSVPLGRYAKQTPAGWSIITCVEIRPADAGQPPESAKHFCRRSQVAAE